MENKSKKPKKDRFKADYHTYEYHKSIISETSKSYEEYERRIKILCDRLKI